jgi:hypothetical protein
MTSSLTVIALIVRLKVSNHTSYGDAEYRDRSTDEIKTFTIKQFANARHDSNQPFKEGDLVLLGGKFTLDNQKLLVSIILLPHNNRFNTILYTFKTYLFCVISLSSRWRLSWIPE